MPPIFRITYFMLRRKPGAHLREAAGLPPPPPMKYLKDTDFCDTKIKKFCHCLPFGRNSSLKSADDQHNRLVKNTRKNAGFLR